MFGRTTLVAAMLLLGSCAVGERPTLTDEALDGAVAAAVDSGEEATTTVPVEAEGPSVGSDLPTIEALGGTPPVLLTPTGVVVPVLARADEGYVVQSPCGNNVELLWGQPIWNADIVIDAGHGGDENGALGPSGETEATLNLEIARRTAAQLEGQGYTVALTRTGDYRVPISMRAAIADQLQAAVFVSIHHYSPTPDLSAGSGTPGSEVYVQVGSDASSRLGGLLHDRVVSALSVFDAEWASRTDAGVLTVLNELGEDAYGINRYPSAPTALVELAYLSNPTEAIVLGTAEYRQAAAAALASAIVTYLETTETGTAPVAEPRLFNPSGDTGGVDGCVDPPLQ